MAVDVHALLLPPPRRFEVLDAFWRLPRHVTVRLRRDPEGGRRAMAWMLAKLSELGFAVSSTETEPAHIELELLPGDRLTNEGYRVRTASARVTISAADPAGLFYGVTTLIQWLALHLPDGADEVTVPGVVIDDEPAFPHRGVLLDISRNKVPTLATLKRLIDQLASWKINQLQLYTEHTFAYRGHETVWRDASPLTGEDIRQLDAWCRERFIELVPNQNSFGHFHRWLIHEPYRRLAECPDGVVHPFSTEPEPFSLCPLDPGSLALLADLYDQLLPNFSSRLCNVGLDETLDLGQGRSAAACAERGRERVYLDFLHAVHRLLAERGCRMMFWGDVILNRPQLIPELPRDAVALEWGYEADHPFAEDGARFAAAGLPFYVCPGTSSWNSFAGRGRNALLNLTRAAVAGRDQGAEGLLITDWGDHGHLQPLVASFGGFVVGAAVAWNSAVAERLAADPSSLDVAALLDRHVFADRAGKMGHLMCKLADVYRLCGAEPVNGSVLFFLTLFGPSELERRGAGSVTPEHLRRALAVVEDVGAELSGVDPQGVDAEVSVAELRWLVGMLSFACRFGIHQLDGPSGSGDQSPAQLRAELARLQDDLSTIWLARNRPGGLAASQARLAAVRRRVLA